MQNNHKHHHSSQTINTILNGINAPTRKIGHNGDFYLDTGTETLYGPKTDNEWSPYGTSLIGPKGPMGHQLRVLH